MSVAVCRLYRYVLDEKVRATAAGFSSPSPRSLDAIHLATTSTVSGELSASVTYDRRLLEEALALDLPATAPR